MFQHNCHLAHKDQRHVRSTSRGTTCESGIMLVSMVEMYWVPTLNVWDGLLTMLPNYSIHMEECRSLTSPWSGESFLIGAIPTPDLVSSVANLTTFCLLTTSRQWRLVATNISHNTDNLLQYFYQSLSYSILCSSIPLMVMLLLGNHLWFPISFLRLVLLRNPSTALITRRLSSVNSSGYHHWTVHYASKSALNKSDYWWHEECTPFVWKVFWIISYFFREFILKLFHLCWKAIFMF